MTCFYNIARPANTERRGAGGREFPVPRPLLPNPPPLRPYPRNSNPPPPLQLAIPPLQVPSAPTPLDERRSETGSACEKPCCSAKHRGKCKRAEGGARALSPSPAAPVTDGRNCRRLTAPRDVVKGFPSSAARPSEAAPPRTALSRTPTSYPPKYSMTRGGPRCSITGSAGRCGSLRCRGRAAMERVRQERVGIATRRHRNVGARARRVGVRLPYGRVKSEGTRCGKS